MKRAWNVVSFIAVVNLMMLLIILAWAWTSGRIDGERLALIRGVLAGDGVEVREVEPPVLSVVPAALDVPLGSAERLAWFDRWEMEQEQRLQQLVDEAERRTREVQSKLTALQQERLAFEAERSSHRKAAETAEAAVAEARFEQTVRLYERARPSTSKAWLMALVDQWGIEQAVRLLEAMDERAATRLLEAMDGAEEQVVATNLLNMLGGPDGTVRNQEMFSDDIDQNPAPATP